MRAYLDGMLRYFEISGRSTRSQYWLFYLVESGLIIAALAIDWHTGGFDPFHPKPTATFFVSLVHIVPNITVQVRRLHDIGRSGFWTLFGVVPIIGPIALLYWACCASGPRNVYDEPAPSTYQPRSGRPSLPRGSTIPRQVRMGSGLARSSASATGDGSSERFI